MNLRFINPAILIVTLLTLSFSCTDPREDHSRSMEAYKALGMPDPGREWDMEDYTQAHNVLAKLKWEHPYELPVKDSEKSGALFDHMLSFEYLSFLQDTALSLNAKAERISEFVRVYDYWIDVYTIPFLKQNPYHREIVDIQIFHLKLMEEMVNLAHKINMSDEPADIALQYGTKYVKENYITSLHNSLKTQRRTDFPEPDLERMADSIYVSFMRNKEWMNSDAMGELKQSLNSVIDSTSSQYIRNKYKNLGKSLGK